MSQVEETIERIKVSPGIDGKKGQVLRRFPTLTQEKAEHFSSTMRQLSQKARSVVRDLDPPNDLRYLRIRAKKHEVMVAIGERNEALEPGKPHLILLEGATYQR